MYVLFLRRKGLRETFVFGPLRDYERRMFRFGTHVRIEARRRISGCDQIFGYSARYHSSEA